METILSQIISNFIDKDKVKYFVNSKNIKYWERAFTHDSINYKINYEKYEFLGDSIIGYGFKKYLYTIRNIKSSQKITDLLGYYMTKEYQPFIAKSIKIDMLGRFNADIVADSNFLQGFHEDILEAFFGVFGNITRDLQKKNPGKFKDPIDYTVDFFTWFFKTHDTLDESKGLPYKHIFQNFYYFFTGESTTKAISGYYNKKTKKYVFSSHLIKGISYYSKKVSKDIYKVLSSTKDNEIDFIIEIVNILFDAGFDIEWRKAEMCKIKFDESISELAKKNGFTRFVLERNNKSSYDLISQKVDPKQKNSIKMVIKSYDYIPFNILKNDAIKVIYEKYGE